MCFRFTEENGRRRNCNNRISMCNMLHLVPLCLVKRTEQKIQSGLKHIQEAVLKKHPLCLVIRNNPTNWQLPLWIYELSFMKAASKQGTFPLRGCYLNSKFVVEYMYISEILGI